MTLGCALIASCSCVRAAWPSCRAWQRAAGREREREGVCGGPAGDGVGLSRGHRPASTPTHHDVDVCHGDEQGGVVGEPRLAALQGRRGARSAGGGQVWLGGGSEASASDARTPPPRSASARPRAPPPAPQAPRTFMMKSPNAAASGSGTPSRSHLRMTRASIWTCAGGVRTRAAALMGRRPCARPPAAHAGAWRPSSRGTPRAEVGAPRRCAHLRGVFEAEHQPQVLEAGRVSERGAQVPERPAHPPHARDAGGHACGHPQEHAVQHAVRQHRALGRVVGRREAADVLRGGEVKAPHRREGAAR
jgi:hypothetical protein